MGAHLAEYGLTPMDDDRWRRRDAVLIRMGQLRRRGIVVVLPPIAGRPS